MSFKIFLLISEDKEVPLEYVESCGNETKIS